MFGALTLSLHKRQPVAVIDSHLSNGDSVQRSDNDVDPEAFSVVRQLAEAPVDVQDVVIKYQRITAC